MAGKNKSVFSRLNDLFLGGPSVPRDMINTGNYTQQPSVSDTVLFSTNDKNEYEKRLTQLKQQKLLSYQWVKAGNDVNLENLAGYTAVKLMYRDADLMDSTPEIFAALNIIGSESCPLKTNGKMLNVYSKSPRVKSVLEDLFLNRLNIHVMLPMIARSTVKYGNTFMLLNTQEKLGILGWKQLPVYEIDRIENGYLNSCPGAGATVTMNDRMAPDEVRFVWTGHNEGLPYRDWQMAHFRLLNDSFFLPYGTSALHGARRAWRMWSMMEDAMLIYRLDKSIERRVYKIYVGSIDDQDVQAYVQQVANNFKRTPIIDPSTGQIDLRKNFMDVSTDYFIPVRSENAQTPIETLQGAQWQNQMDDIEYMQNKIFAALQVPKKFLNFQEAQGKGENLAVQDVRFARMVNRVQQFLLMELNKIAMIHLYLIGMTDDVSNFTLSLNSPSSQIEAQELTEMTSRITLAAQALADPGIGMPILSYHRVMTDIMKYSDDEIKTILNEIRLEKAMAAELASTQNIIKKTGMFDQTDRIYGDYEAMNAPDAAQQPQEQGAAPGGAAPGGASGAMPPMGGGEPGEDAGAEGEVEMSEAPGLDNGSSTGAEPSASGGAPIMEGVKRKATKSFTSQYFEMLNNLIKENKEIIDKEFDFETKATTINEKVNNLFRKLDEMNLSGTSYINEDVNEGAENVIDEEVQKEIDELKNL